MGEENQVEEKKVLTAMDVKKSEAVVEPKVLSMQEQINTLKGAIVFLSGRINGATDDLKQIFPNMF